MFVTGMGEGLGQNDSSPIEVPRALDGQRLNGNHLLTSFENQFNLSIDPSQIRPSEVLSPDAIRELDP
jgi:hypothetical protein